jgi:predicted deacylase
VPPGTRRIIDMPLPSLYTRASVSMSIQVVHGKRPGPVLLLSAALHGDELNGVEIVRRTLARLDREQITGTVIAVPIVNVYGFLNQSRYLPDRRDLNRSFPGAPDGSLTSRLAHQFLNQIVVRCTHGVDLHTAAMSRENLPQVRGELADPETRHMAATFGAPVMVQAAARDGSLREAALVAGLKMLLYEGGEPLRFNDDAIQIGVRGILRVMRALGMRKGKATRLVESPVELAATRWLRARQSGILRLTATLGERVVKGQVLGTIADPFGERTAPVRAVSSGIIVGQVKNPLVHRGDAIVHVGLPL